jgi:hypothetical protein
MLKLYLWLQMGAYRLLTRFDEPDDERGSVTTEHVLWAVAVIAIVGVVVAAIKAYVTNQAGNIK